MRFLGLLALLSVLASTSPALAQAWQIDGQVPPGLTYTDDGAVIYRLECMPSGVVVTQYGVTKLTDLKANKPVGDAPGSVMSDGALFMSLATDKASPDMTRATAVPNSRFGWDMRIVISKRDRAYRTLPRATLISLFTTGHTRAVLPTETDRVALASFVERCGKK